jgi:hypothetical protein
MDEMGKMIFLGSTRKAHVHLHHIGFKIGADEKIDTQIHLLSKQKSPSPIQEEGGSK